ncbi:MAG: isoprenoid biosynthesis glyoxalase ElbB [Alphaproteobacteria bacterium]|nr:isoprenoid biosynthesis glyoxalase ElbB [Alphaproteobacteria bacterium]
MTKVAVILSGCGHMDGAEIREAVVSLLALSREGAEVQCFAPDIAQHHVVNHLTGKEMPESRNVLVEAARIARGKVKPLSEAKAKDFDALVIPGGFGVAKNLSNLAFKGPEAQVLPDFARVVSEFLAQHKPIGAICIAPAVLVAAIGRDYAPTVTIGEDKGTAEAIAKMGGTHVNRPSDDIAVDEKNNIVSCSAYMRNDELAPIADGIEKLVSKVIALAQSSKARKIA